jgi:F0F1-type ATP synthase membrane subunit b/b'
MIISVVDWTINLGQIITISTVLFALVAVFYGVKERVSLLEQRNKRVEDRLARVEDNQQRYLEENLPIMSKLTLKILNGK